VDDPSHGAQAAIADYDAAIAIIESLCDGVGIRRLARA
jgi:hypothetical protein